MILIQQHTRTILGRIDRLKQCHGNENAVADYHLRI